MTVSPALQEGFPTEATGVSLSETLRERLWRALCAYPKGFPDLGEERC